jgi:hypothetical protein
MLTIYNNDETVKVIEGPELEELEREHRSVQDELTASGELVETNELSPTDAKVVRIGSEGPLVTDGPFSETKEWVGGYYVVECPDVERAVAIAGRFVEARTSLVEVRRLGAD